MNIYVSFLNIIHIDFLTLKFIILPILCYIFATSIVTNNALNLFFMAKCEKCKFWVFTCTLSSLDDPIWHCRFGFSPSVDCISMAEYNVKCIRAYYKKYPQEQQLKLKF